MISVRYHQAAQDELLGQIRYLEERSRGLGELFFREVQTTERMIACFPKAVPEILPGIRKCVLRKFPFSLIYSIEDDCVLILAIAHSKRRPGYWLGRG